MSLQNRLILIFTMTYSNYIIKASLSLSGYNIRPKHTWLFEWGRIIRISCSCSFLKVRWSFYISTTYVILFWITHPWVRYPKENMTLQTGLFKRQCVHLSNSTHTTGVELNPHLDMAFALVFSWSDDWTPLFLIKVFEQWHR